MQFTILYTGKSEVLFPITTITFRPRAFAVIFWPSTQLSSRRTELRTGLLPWTLASLTTRSGHCLHSPEDIDVFSFQRRPCPPRRTQRFLSAARFDGLTTARGPWLTRNGNTVEGLF